jgi:hypothetical protein
MIVRAYASAEPPRTLGWLAERAGVPEQLAKDVLDVFVGRGYLTPASHAGRLAYVPARDITTVRAGEVTAVLMGAPDDEPFAPDLTDAEGLAIARMLEDMDGEAARIDENRTLGQLAADSPPAHAHAPLEADA